MASFKFRGFHRGEKYREVLEVAMSFFPHKYKIFIVLIIYIPKLQL